MSKRNLFLDPDDEIETFRDVITDNAFFEDQLLKKVSDVSAHGTH